MQGGSLQPREMYLGTHYNLTWTDALGYMYDML